MWLFEYVRRLLTDVRVDCQLCKRRIGYVVKNGHQRWLCENCSCCGFVEAV